MIHIILTFVILILGQSGQDCASWKCFTNYSALFVSATGSILQVSIPPKDKNNDERPTLLINTVLLLLFSVENVLLTAIPIYQEITEDLKCFVKSDEKYLIVAVVATLSFLPFLFQGILYYKCCHPWKSINGPQFENGNLYVMYNLPCKKGAQKLSCFSCCKAEKIDDELEEVKVDLIPKEDIDEENNENADDNEIVQSLLSFENEKDTETDLNN